MSFFEHALHNDSAFAHMSKTNEFNDWSVTIAFYAALHFVRGKSKKNGLFTDFETWFKAENRKARECDNFTFNKHLAVQNLAYQLGKDCGDEYKRLLSFSKNSRYHSYKVTNNQVTCAKFALEKVKQATYCVESL
jgi:hypothetical protein